MISCHKNQEQQKNFDEEEKYFMRNIYLIIFHKDSRVWIFDIFSWPSLKPGSISAFKVKRKIHAPQTKQ